MARVETGVVQFGDDWPGVFIRGDQAAWFAISLRCALPSLDFSERITLEQLVEVLESCNVSRKPTPRLLSQPAAQQEPRGPDSKLRREIAWYLRNPQMPPHRAKAERLASWLERQPAAQQDALRTKVKLALDALSDGAVHEARAHLQAALAATEDRHADR